MQIIVNITDEDYEGLKRKDKFDDLFLNYYEKAIVRGTPLPKGHGRLGDLDELEKEMVNGIKSGNFEDGYEDYPHINNMDDCVECVKYADTIIEADTDKKVEQIKDEIENIDEPEI